MYFTHLVDADNEAIDQNTLQKYAYFLLIFVLSDENVTWVNNRVGTALQASGDTLCWVVQPKHLKAASPGSALAQIDCAIKERFRIPNIEHSFIAWISKKDFLQGRTDAGGYEPLYLLNEDDIGKRQEKLQKALKRAFKEVDSDIHFQRLKDRLPVAMISKALSQILGLLG